MPERKCPAYDICHELGTVRDSCSDLLHHRNPYDKSEPSEIKSLSEVNSRLTEIQACLSSVVVSLHQKER
jgi:hypothetical protein